MYPVLEKKITAVTSGEELTQLIRKLTLDGLSHYAHARMKKAIPSLSDAKIIKLLTAQKTLSGNINEMEIVEEKPDIKKQFQDDLIFYQNLRNAPSISRRV